RGRKARRTDPQSQLGLFAPPPAPVDPSLVEIGQALQAVEVDALRPLDALNLLAAWRAKLGG
ncbi:MAG TPA: hypothetical protein VLC54_09525, partial [Anaeromyxobacter sp.]|nr:hypothetical protein [Anaeromyxobacter sp.]